MTDQRPISPCMSCNEVMTKHDYCYECRLIMKSKRKKKPTYGELVSAINVLNNCENFMQVCHTFDSLNKVLKPILEGSDSDSNSNKEYESICL